MRSLRDRLNQRVADPPHRTLGISAAGSRFAHPRKAPQIKPRWACACVERAYSCHASSSALSAPSHAPRCSRCFSHQAKVDPLRCLSASAFLLRSPMGSSRSLCRFNHGQNVISRSFVAVERNLDGLFLFRRVCPKRPNWSVTNAQSRCDDFCNSECPRRVLAASLFAGGAPAPHVCGSGKIGDQIRVDRRVHKVYLCALPLLIVGQSLATYMWRSNPSWWQGITHAILG